MFFFHVFFFFGFGFYLVLFRFWIIKGVLACIINSLTELL